ncbi:MAG TPA: alkaline phosphatase family protein [Thermoanaerobaculia bacterium]|nr:alkaline phosphatase family protein [Thermoanaerobaculia bacterium]
MRTEKRIAATLAALLMAQTGTPLLAAEPDAAPATATATPIEHVIVIIGENRTFDNVFGTYKPKQGQTVWNLRSRGIVNDDGSPGPNAALAAQSEIATIDPVAYFVSTVHLNDPGKSAYSTLPTPEAGNAPPLPVTLTQLDNAPVAAAPPFDKKSFSKAQLQDLSGALGMGDLVLLTTGATGLSNCNPDPTTPPFACPEPDTRIDNYAALPNTSFQITGKNVKYDSYTGDMVHRFFHMWQQSDCDVSTKTDSNPTGCLNDLYPYVGISRGDDSGSNSMGFYNMKRGDASFFKQLADKYTINDNYHQPVMGGTAVQHIMIGTADALTWDVVPGLPSTPPASQIADPTPKSSTSDKYTNDKRWTGCNSLQPGFDAIHNYLQSLPWRPDLTPSTCVDGKYYMINNTRPGFLSNGDRNDAEITLGTAAPPSSLRTIGDALNDADITWAYYGGGYNHAVAFDNGSTDPFDVMIGTEGDWYCDICNPFQYAASIMGVPAQRQAHIKDAVDFFTDLDNGNLPSVSYIKPDSFDDGHPASSKPGVFEALVQRIVNKVQSSDQLFKNTAIFVTFDEGGGYWDSGFYQPIDFFGDGPRIPMIVVSKFSRGGNVVHSYNDHASIVKFIERNWGLSPLTARSRDNLHNPTHVHDPYIPDNMPAIGDLFDMFDFH